MELRQLRYFVAVAEEENFTRAARRCHISQPSLSQQIINLEEELETKLLYRLGRKALLTASGRALLGRAKRMLTEAQNARDELSDAEGGTGRQISFGTIPTVAPYLFPMVLAEMQKEMPGTRVFFTEEFRNDLTTSVVNGSVDLALISMPVTDPHVETEILFQEPLMLVMGRQHRLAKKELLDVEDIAEEPFLLLGGPSSVAMRVRAYFGDHDIEPNITARCTQLKTLKALAASGLGVSILPRLTARTEDRDTLVYRPLAGPRSPYREVALVRHRQRYESRGVRQMVDILRRLMRSSGLTVETTA